MKVTAIYVYPIKALRPIRLDRARLTPQGVQHDRRFMLCRVDDTDPRKLTKVQIDKVHQCGLFRQEIVGDSIHVSYLTPRDAVAPAHPVQNEVLEVPLSPDTSALDTVDIDLHLSMVTAYRMGARYDDWFSACFGFKAALAYIGDGRRPVLGSYAPQTQTTQTTQTDGSAQRPGGWLLSTMSATVSRGGAAETQPRLGSEGEDKPWLAFSDLAPFLVASDASLANVRARVPSGDVAITAFRPNIVVDGHGGPAFDEDFWAELSANGEPFLVLTKMCNRCSSLNVDYDTGKIAEGERGTVLKKLMSDRRVDAGARYSPVFGKYGFLSPARDGMFLSVGDQITVTERVDQRPVFDWPLRARGAQPQFYQAA
ncbi:MOSC domain containing protein [Metarhizium album ARSEF 1941]|uniref:MOSC domain containing protein n=1 Tax=Metarhizium album (strain ARSEF 1941) TaxID=1081103 RepID=A0A0B2WVD9_METAS|nr:MOSC domain containing protein [Metarhizium album ARSEF 1941]KHN98038.1 MOSC domain containing protein [Metarhizium album ARSEF 1941]